MKGYLLSKHEVDRFHNLFCLVLSIIVDDYQHNVGLTCGVSYAPARQ
jgi:hypothetical protein